MVEWPSELWFEGERERQTDKGWEEKRPNTLRFVLHALIRSVCVCSRV